MKTVRITTLLFLSLVFLVGCKTAEDSTVQKDHQLVPVKVTHVVDGDTMDVQFQDGTKETIRLLLVDTPETVHPDKPIQPLGPQASTFAEQTLSGQDVNIEIGESKRDKYDRLLVYVYVDGNMFNEMLLAKGFARVAYIYPPNTK